MDYQSKDKQVGMDDVAAGTVGAVTGGGAAAVLGHLGGVGLAIGGTAVGVPAVVVVAVPAVLGGACFLGIWKGFKAMKCKKNK